MAINWNDFQSIIIILAVLLLSGFTWYFPLRQWLKQPALALQFTIPFSISVEIIVGYVFYSFGKIELFIPTYLGLVLVLNVLAMWLLQKSKQRFFVHSIKKPTLVGVVFFALVVVVFYTRFYDAVSTLAPGNNDTYNHFLFINDLKNIGHLSNQYYPPGFHLLLYPFAYLIPRIAMYRFVGAGIGILVMVSIYLLLRERLVQRSSRVLILSLFIVPIYNQLTLQTISLFSSALTFIYFIAFIVLSIKSNELPNTKRMMLISAMSIALGVTVPYFFVQYIAALGVVYILTRIFKKRFFEKQYQLTWHVIGFAVLGLVIGVGHVFLQTKIVARNSTRGFPEIPTVETNGTNVVVNSNYANEKTKEINNKKIDESNTIKSRSYINKRALKPYLQNVRIWTKVTKFIEQQPILKSNVLPMFITGIDILSVKNIRTFDNVLSVGAYLWLGISIIVVWYAIRVKWYDGLFVGVLSFVYGVITQTGMLEMSFYRGRSGWYLMFLSIITIVYVFDRISSKYFSNLFKWLTFVFSGICIVVALLYPPQFYRPYYAETFFVAKKIVEKYPNKKIAFITSQFELPLISENIFTYRFSSDTLSEVDVLEYDQSFIIMEKKFLEVDPVLSQQAYSTDRGFSEFSNRMKTAKQERENTIHQIKQSKLFSHYFLYWENENLVVYQYSNT